MTTLAKDPHGDVDEPQFIDASKLVSKDTKVSATCIKGKQLWTGLADSTNLKASIFNPSYHALLQPIMKCWQ